VANPEHLRILEKKWHLNPFKQSDDAWHKWRDEHREIRPDLRNAFLFKRDLRDENFSGADLRGANLVGAVVSRANLRGTDLRGTHCNSANFYRADLTDAVLGGADMTEVNFSACSLKRTNFEGAILGGTIFGDNDLLCVNGLESAVHLYPSTIGMDTLRSCGGKLPTSFLRGCGLTDLEIEAVKLHNPYLTNSEMDGVLRGVSDAYVGHSFQYYSCFISYSHADKTFALKLHDRLQRSGIRCWLDEKQILPGDDIYDQVDRGIKLWDKVLLCCSEHSLKSWWVDNEISAAFAKEQQIMTERGKKVLALIPLNLDGYLFSWTNGKAKQVLTRSAANFAGWNGDFSIFEAEAEKIVSALRVNGGARETPPEPRL
jgi:uncharacterized protein YjbI with pentapeptide repeats